MHLLMLFIICTNISSLLCTSEEDARYLAGLRHCYQAYQSCVSGKRNVYCGCDQMCPFYDNCCFDAESQIGSWKEKTMKNEKHITLLQCISCEAIEFNSKPQHEIFMVSSCPSSWMGNDDIREMCQDATMSDFLDLFPVSDIKLDITFKNRHCAVCHGSSNYIPWVLDISCPDHKFKLSSSLSMTEALLFKIRNESCRYEFKLPDRVNLTLRHCYSSYNYTLKTRVDIENMSSCDNRVFTPLIRRTPHRPTEYYRNFQCLLDLYGATFVDVLPHLRCFYLTHITTPMIPSLSSLIDVSSLFYYHQEDVSCKEKEVDLSGKIGCQLLYCPVGSEPLGGECRTVGRGTNGVHLDLLFEGTDMKTLNRHMILLMQSLSEGLKTDIGNYHFNYMKEYLVVTECTQGTYKANASSCFTIQINLPVQLANSENIESLRATVYNSAKTYTNNMIDGFLELVEDVRNLSCNCNVTLRQPEYVLDAFSVDDDIPCPAVKVHYFENGTSDDLSDGAPDDYQYFTLGGEIISPSDIVYVDDEHFVCIDTILSKYHWTENNQTETYRRLINTICSSLSILGLFYCLLQYCVVPILRDGKSDLFIVLVVFLLVSQTCFLLLAHFHVAEGICEWLGIVHHFTWLGSFTFMFLCLFRLNIDIRSLKSYSRCERSISSLRYTLVGVVVPVIIVSCTKTINLIVAPTAKWYGEGICFISLQETHVSLLAFVLPILMTMCANIILFICILRYISSTAIATNSNKSQVFVFFKISTIMGLSWIIGMVAVVFRSDVLSIMFEVLTNLQGTFITCSFACTARVRKYYTERFYPKQTQTTT